MPFEIDHLFVVSEFAAPIVDKIVTAGFIEGSARNHPGQGTANRRIFFYNNYLEFLFLTLREETLAENIERTGIIPRCRRDPKSCPIGIALRKRHSDTTTESFPTWTYQPHYMPPELNIQIATTSHNCASPLVFLVPNVASTPSVIDVPEHPTGARFLTDICVGVPADFVFDEPCTILQNAGIAKFVPSADWRVELTFDNGHRGGYFTGDSFGTALTLRW